VIHRRREGDLVRTGINILWGPLAKNVILSLPWFSLHVLWNRHTRRLTFAAPLGFNWRAPIGPWRRIAEMRLEIHRKEREILALDHALKQSADRYDKIRETNLQLRDALTLYRNA
jgi:hypothetical protein